MHKKVLVLEINNFVVLQFSLLPTTPWLIMPLIKLAKFLLATSFDLWNHAEINLHSQETWMLICVFISCFMRIIPTMDLYRLCGGQLPPKYHAIIFLPLFKLFIRSSKLQCVSKSLVMQWQSIPDQYVPLNNLGTFSREVVYIAKLAVWTSVMLFKRNNDVWDINQNLFKFTN